MVAAVLADGSADGNTWRQSDARDTTCGDAVANARNARSNDGYDANEWYDARWDDDDASQSGNDG